MAGVGGRVRAHPIPVRLSTGLLRALDGVAVEWGVPRSVLMRRALVHYLRGVRDGTITKERS